MASRLRQRAIEGQVTIRTKGSSKCAIHVNRQLVFICNDCNQLLCTTCCVSGHRNHNLKELSDVVLQQRTAIQDFVEETEKNKLPELQQKLETINDKITDTENHFGTVVPGNIKLHGKVCKKDINDWIHKMEANCREKETENVKLLKECKTKILDRYAKLVLKTKECKETLQSGNVVMMYDMLSNISSMKTETCSMPTLDTTEYKPGTEVTNHMKQAMGTLITQSAVQTLLRDQLQPGKRMCSAAWLIITQKSVWSWLASIILLFAVPLAIGVPVYYALGQSSYPGKILPTSDGFWYLEKRLNTIVRIRFHDENLAITHSTSIRDISLSPTTGSLWICSYSDNVIYEIPPSSQLPIQRFQIDGHPQSLYVIRNGNVIVGSSWNHLTIFTENGKVIHTIYDNTIFMIPRQITECPKTGNIAVVREGFGLDFFNGLRSQIAVYDSTLKFKFIYEIQVKEKYSLQGSFPTATVAYDSFGNIVIGNYKTNTIELITGTGKYVKRLFKIKEKLVNIALETHCNILWVMVRNTETLKVATKIRQLKPVIDSNECCRILSHSKYKSPLIS